jgi:hypothetical protein
VATLLICRIVANYKLCSNLQSPNSFVIAGEFVGLVPGPEDARGRDGVPRREAQG